MVVCYEKFDNIRKTLIKDKKLNDDEMEYLKQKALELGASRSFIISPKNDLIFHDSVKLLCFNCQHYNHKICCPPKIPKLDYEKLIGDYKNGIIVIVDVDFVNKQEFDRVRIESTNRLHKILLELEKIAFNKENPYAISFIGGSCKLCPQGCSNEKCRNQGLSRIPLEATGIDVIKSLEKIGVELRFPVKDHKKLSRVGLLLPNK